MQDGMDMMDAMGADRMRGMKGTHGMGAMPGSAPTSGELATRQEMMEESTAVMQCINQLITDRVLPPLATGVFRFCPAYWPLGLSTCPARSVGPRPRLI